MLARFRLFFSDPLHLKVWFATAAAFLACLQILSAAWIYRVLPWAKPAWVNPFHRWTGRLAFVATLPVAYHCIFKLGFQHTVRPPLRNADRGLVHERPLVLQHGRRRVVARGPVGSAPWTSPSPKSSG